ncbi:MAG: DJ-1/PfpI family protein [Saccharofermentans sp.]|jgi:4-methyl-5(b-hydroxyethyl)-thiazole monophosphate biosynthesis|nr:DJ-1/PfpI family protein [Mageeibacillus sp.]MCI1263991.1 DJ-1/PfpI family protein [Saccharofermentans sp.]MCI1274553.1 DJ-1/PfpI family protein [Saccharofermentans sp.]MCI1768936.1 DJ-1/PfpI family protein [Mageeibacillus sp.]MCI2043839.1 DJ-1/PfpI family protein [Mageeibacillus sp.]
MIRIAIMLADGSEEVEAVAPADICRRAGIEANMVSVMGRLDITASRGIKITADLMIEDINIDDYDMIVLPGGVKGTENFKASQILNNYIIDFADKGKGLAAICAAPTVYSGLGLLKGRHAVCNPYFFDELRSDGALLDEDARVITADNIITSKAMGTALDFGLAIVEFFLGESGSSEMCTSLCY